jgi:hypothetical protein
LPGANPAASARWFVAQMAKKYPHATRADKASVLALIKKGLPPNPGPGRPRRADVTEALHLEAAGVSRKEIYRRLGKATHNEQHALREAMRQRKARRRKRDKSQAVTPTNPAQVCTV